MSAVPPPTAALPTLRSPGSWQAPSPALPPTAFLDAETHRLLRFAEGATAEGGGFASLDEDGRVAPEQPIRAWVSCRMTYCFALGALLGREGDGERVDHGLAALLPGGCLRDDTHGGWYDAVAPADGAGPRRVVDGTKGAYAHAFVVLAASAAVVAGRPGAQELLTDALAVVEERFWDESAGVVRESFGADWTDEEAYRGANANMHSVEAFLAVSDALPSRGRLWRRRAGRIIERFVHGAARDAGWLLPEHFGPDLQVLPRYNLDRPTDPFRPYGVTPGHLFEWSRLCLHLLAADVRAGDTPPHWLLADAVALYRTAVDIGWAPDGQPGFVYTTDVDRRPVARSRLHWVLTEALGAAAALHQVTGEAAYGADHSNWWDFAAAHFLDHERGSWHAELTADLRPATGTATWRGKPDIYHALQATLLPRLPLAPMFAGALRATLLAPPPPGP